MSSGRCLVCGNQILTTARLVIESVVAIHGLDTHSPRTWVAFEDEADAHSRVVHWLKDSDMLPAFIGDARIFTYDWNANTLDGASNQYFHSHAEQLLQRLQRGRRGVGHGRLCLLSIPH